ncbi:MAG: Hsp70 family protein [Planctomycetota bacterium]
MTEPTSTHPVGIDLGTTFSTVAFLDSTGRPETIRNSEGDLTTPSAVFFDQKQPIVGVEAIEAGLLEPDRLAVYAKRDIGEDHYEKAIRGKQLPSEVIQAIILRKLRADAEMKLGQIQEAVITVPAFFNEPCRKATQDAGRLAGIRVLDIINEPTAAAITYGIEQGFLKPDGTSAERETVLVYDLGGGTFDVTLMEIEGGNFKTIATAGDVYLGGIDWDQRIVDFISEAFLEEHGIDPRQDDQATQELQRKANQTKHALTQRESVSIAFAHDGKRLRTELTEEHFAERCADLVERTLLTVQLLLDDADVSWDQLTRLILVGGSTRMPMIRRELERASSMTLDRSLSPDEAVSHGAALYAGMILGKNGDTGSITIGNVNSHDLGVLAMDPKTGKPRRQIMIPRNSALPARKEVRFRTHEDNQANVRIDVVEGGDDRGINATQVGKCIVDDLPQGTRKGARVDVTFDYGADGRLTVHARLPEIEREVSMTLNRAVGLCEDDLLRWESLLDQGLSDSVLADLEEPVGGKIVELGSVSQTPQQLQDSQQVASEQPVKSEGDHLDSAPNGASEAFAAEPMEGSKDDSEDPVFAPLLEESSRQPVRQNVLPPFGEPEEPAKVTADELRGFTDPPAPASIEAPVLNLDAGQDLPTKADTNDFAQLAALGKEADASAPAGDVPLIVTEGSATPKKTGGLFKRRKKG